MKKNILLVQPVAALIILFFNSCIVQTPVYDPYIVEESRQKENVYYVSSAPNTQLLTEKNDLGFNIMSSSSNKVSGVDMQASFLPGKNVGLIGGYSAERNGEFVHYKRFEFGAGYIKPFKGGWHFETYAGAGHDKIDNLHHTGISDLNLKHFFIQPAIAISNKKKTVQFAVVSKFSGVDFKVDTTFNNDREPFSTSQVQSLYNKSFQIMWEPGVIFRFGWKNFLFHTSYSHFFDLTNSSLYGSNDNFSIGASFRFNTGKKTKQ